MLHKEEALANAQERHRSIAPSGVCVAGDEGTMVTMAFVVWIFLDGEIREKKKVKHKKHLPSVNSRCLFGGQAINWAFIRHTFRISGSLARRRGP